MERNVAGQDLPRKSYVPPLKSILYLDHILLAAPEPYLVSEEDRIREQLQTHRKTCSFRQDCISRGESVRGDAGPIVCDHHGDSEFIK